MYVKTTLNIAALYLHSTSNYLGPLFGCRSCFWAPRFCLYLVLAHICIIIINLLVAHRALLRYRARKLLVKDEQGRLKVTWPVTMLSTAPCCGIHVAETNAEFAYKTYLVNTNTRLDL
jgi:hypothetical protein